MNFNLLILTRFWSLVKIILKLQLAVVSWVRYIFSLSESKKVETHNNIKLDFLDTRDWSLVNLYS